MEYINIVKKLHKTFPEFDIDTVIKILEVIKSEDISPWVIPNDKTQINTPQNKLVWST